MFLDEYLFFTRIRDEADKEVDYVIKTGKKAPSTDANRVIMITTSLKQVERLDKPNCMLYKCRIESYLSEISIVG